MQQPPIQPSHVPLHVHGDFNDIYSAINLLSLGADALTGIGNLMQPESKGGDEQLNLANRSDVSAVFRFFGEVLKEPTQVVYNSVECVQQAAEDQLP